MKSHRSCAAVAMKTIATTIATTVPSMRSAALLSDWPTFARLTNATANAAQWGWSHSICRAMP